MEHENELYHYGVLGMRWGVRRYQNRDGSLTNAGKKKYNKEMAKLEAKEKVLKNKQRNAAKIDKLNAKKKSVADLEESLNSTKTKTKQQKTSNTAKKSIKDLSDDELRERVNRLELEKRYKDLSKQLYSDAAKKKNSKAKEFVLDTLERSGKNIATQAVTYGMGAAVNKTIGNLVGDSQMVNPKKGQKDK